MSGLNYVATDICPKCNGKMLMSTAGNTCSSCGYNSSKIISITTTNATSESYFMITCGIEKLNVHKDSRGRQYTNPKEITNKINEIIDKLDAYARYK